METSILIQFVLAVVVVVVWRHFEEIVVALTEEPTGRERLPGDGRTEVE